MNELAKFFCLILGFIFPCIAVAEIDVSIVWKKISGDSYSASISPKGTVEYPLKNWPDKTAVYCSAAVGCESTWYLKINSKRFSCPATVFSVKNTKLTEHSVKVNRIMMVPCTFFNEYKFKGDETICLYLDGIGWWQGEITGGGTLYYYRAGSGCPWSGGTPEEGGDISPPVKPASCALNGDVAINYGEINLKQLNGREATTTARLSCSREVTAEVSVSNTGVINLNDSGSLRSTIYISGVKGKNTFRNVINADVVFKSVISFDGGYVSGYFSRSAVVTVSII